MDHNPTIIKLGSTMPSLATRHGDFEDWVISGMGLTRDDVRVIDPTQGEALPPPDALPGIVLTGSHAMVTDREPWSEADGGVAAGGRACPACRSWASATVTNCWPTRSAARSVTTRRAVSLAPSTHI